MSTSRRLDISKGDTTHVRVGDVFFARRQNEHVVVVELVGERYARVVSKEKDKARLWRLPYLASDNCDLQTHASPDLEFVDAWLAKT